MAEAASYVRGLVSETAEGRAAPRHSALVRVTHWIFALSFFGLVVSGVGIILAHPHFYWGETGNIETTPLFSLPLPTMLGGPSGWGRYLHFQSAWIAVLTGALYFVSGVLTGHFRKELVPAAAELKWSSLRASVADHLQAGRLAEERSYNVLQRLSYLGVIFVLFPMTILTGLAMSPVITSVAPLTVTMFGGHQSARTLHFFLSDLLVLFLMVHVGMVVAAGFGRRMRGMIR